MTLLRCAAAILVYIPFVCTSLLPRLNINDTSIHTLNAGDSPPSNNTRTLWHIIWSCGVTLFACTWTAIHPNIPGMSEGRVTIFLRRLFLMVIAWIAPELIILWASRQLFSAIAIAKKFNDALSPQRADTHDHDPDVEAMLLSEFPESSGSSSVPRPAEFEDWTITHGFYAWMGGFILYVEGQPRATLTPHELLYFVRQKSVDMPVIIKADIEDRSKGDIISKGIAILQLLWFICQLAARPVQNLPVSLLEIDTLAIAVLTCIAYFMWWKKPKDVGRPYIVHWKLTTPPSSTLFYNEVDSRFSHQFRYLFYLVYPWISSAGMGTIMSPSAVHSRRVASLGGYGEPDDVITALKIIGGHVIRLVMRAAPRLFRGNQITPLTGGHARGPPIQISATSSSVVSGSMMTVFIGGCIGALMGGFHCLAWNFLFQTLEEQRYWRLASLVITGAPTVVLVQSLLARKAATTESGLARLGYFIAICYFVLYVAERIIIFVLIILSFRSPPPGVYDVVDWTKFVPHL